jgi:hypothetical protein
MKRHDGTGHGRRGGVSGDRTSARPGGGLGGRMRSAIMTHVGTRHTIRLAGGPGLAGGLVPTLLLVLGLAAGCGGSSSGSTAPAVPADAGTVRLVPPGGCEGAPCAGTSLDGVQISGPLTLGPFSLTFGAPSILPFAPPGAYTVSGATFASSTNDTVGCPTAGFTVATGRMTTLTFAITNDVCRVSVSSPA